MNAADSELLARYLDRKDEAAFSQLVDVYGGLVLGAARRVTGETEAAKEAAQSTFIALARKAGSLRGRQSLGGWLHYTAMLSARNVVRSRQREERKRAAVQRVMEPMNGTCADDHWLSLRPVLDDSLAALPEKDRDAVVLRFYRGCSVQEVASIMEVSLAAAQKRLGRALEKLRSNLQHQGVHLPMPALCAGLGLWAANSPKVTAMTALWASTAVAAPTGPTSLGSSWTLTSIVTAMTNSKITSALVVTALLLGGGAIAWNKSQDRGKGRPPAAGSGGLPSSSAKARRSRVADHSARRIEELEAKFGSEQMRQARRIVTLIQAGYRAEGEVALSALDAKIEDWLKEAKAKWGLDESRGQELALLVAKAHDQRVADFKKAVYRMGEERTAAALEAILLADQVARGELPREDFEEACYRLSLMDSAEELELNMGSLLSIDVFFLNEEFAAAVEEVIPAEWREQFHEENQSAIKHIMTSQLAAVRHHVPDLSDEQAEQLTAFYRKTGVCHPRLSMVEQFLTETQRSAWLAKEARQAQLARTITQLPRIGPRGEVVVSESKTSRMPVNGAPAVYPWMEPMTLDAAEKEARRSSRGESFSEGSESAPATEIELTQEGATE